ncbi:MAG: hypothetical protein CSA81_05400 [Acidobacteria bacterium]|nr:MAG: hypothetical protein CSA81_05400 [Acidobacteriota bacterium]
MFFKKKDSAKELAKIQTNADKLYSQKKYQKALNEYLKLTKAMPDDLLLLNKIGDAYSKIKDTRNAFKYFERVAQHHSSTGFLPKAIAVYKKILKLDPEYTEARESLVKLYLQKQHTSEAKAELKKIADHYLNNNLMSRALDTLRKLVELEPSNIQYHNQLAEILIKEGRSRDACREFHQMAVSFLEKDMLQQAKMVIKKALNLNSDHVDILIVSAEIALKEGQYEKGAAKLQRVLSEQPDHFEALRVMGQTLFQRGDFDKALQCYGRILQNDPSQTEQVIKLIETLIQNRDKENGLQYIKLVSKYLIQKKEFEPAISLARNLLEIDETYGPSVYLMASTYLKTERTANAILTLEKAANHYLNINRPAEAEPFIVRILELDSDNLEWKSQLKSIQRPPSTMDVPSEEELAEMDQPLEIPTELLKRNEESNLEEISALISGDVDSSYVEDTSTSIQNKLTEVEILVRHGLNDKALTHLEEILAKYPDHFDANSQLVQIYYEQNDQEKAAESNVALAKHYIEKGAFDKALEHLEEAEPFLPAETRRLKGEIECRENLDNSLRQEEVSLNAYDPEFSSGYSLNGANPSQDNLIIQPPSDEEIVRIEPKSAELSDFESPGYEKNATDDSVWALDIPAVGHDDIQVTDQTFDSEETVLDFMKDDRASEEEPALELDFEADDLNRIQIPDVDDDFEKENQPSSDEISLDSMGLDSLEMEESLDTDEEITALEDDTEVLEEVETDMDSHDHVSVPQQKEADASSESQSDLNDSILGELEDIDFFISMEAYPEARNLVAEAIERHGSLPELIDKQNEISQLNNEDSSEESESSRDIPENDLFDLASVLSDEFFDEEKDVTDNPAPEEFQSVEELFQEFKKGVAEQISDNDYQTHYDLGIAYKEMGLLTEGVAEFELAKGDPRRYLDCVTMIATCQKQMGESADAISTLLDARKSDKLSLEERHVLSYELGTTYEANGDLEQALAYFKSIVGENPNFRDVQERIEMLV